MTAFDALRNHQEQLDEEGVRVVVSRQALDEVLKNYDEALACLAATQKEIIYGIACLEGTEKATGNEYLSEVHDPAKFHFKLALCVPNATLAADYLKRVRRGVLDDISKKVKEDNCACGHDADDGSDGRCEFHEILECFLRGEKEPS